MTSTNCFTKRLAKFVETSHGPNLVYLCPQIDELLISVLYDIQKRYTVVIKAIYSYY